MTLEKRGRREKINSVHLNSNEASASAKFSLIPLSTHFDPDTWVNCKSRWELNFSASMLLKLKVFKHFSDYFVERKKCAAKIKKQLSLDVEDAHPSDPSINYVRAFDSLIIEWKVGLHHHEWLVNYPLVNQLNQQCMERVLGTCYGPS